MKDQEPKHEAIQQYEDILTRLHGESALVYVSNFDDLYHGWDVMVEPFVMLRFMVRMAEPYFVRIEVHKTQVLEMKVHKTTVFHGGLPGDKESNPDFEFIEKILGNMNCFL